MSEAFAIELKADDRGHLIRLKGDATADRMDDLQAALDGAVSKEAARIVLDLAELKFICSMALGLLIEFRSRVAEHRAALRLAGATPQIEAVFRETRLVELFPMYPNAENALTTD